MKVIVGLGNPGEKYAKTRHNLGWSVVQAFAEKNDFTFKEESKFRAHVAKKVVGEETVILVLPTTYMNESGTAVGSILQFYKLVPSDIIIVVDDIALPFGQMRIRTNGSSGGHNGLKSIEKHLGTQNYLRVRLGIGNEPERDLSDYVLDRFTSAEAEQLPEIEHQAVRILEMLLTQEVEKVEMNCLGEKQNERKDEKKPL